MKLVSAAIAAVFAWGLAGAALAQEEAAPAGGAATAGNHAAHHPGSARHGASSGSMAGMEQMHKQMHGMHLSGAHSMTGTITSIDHRTGIIHFRTPEGTLRIHFPPSTTRHLRAGNTITVYLGYERGRGTHGAMGGTRGGHMRQGMRGQRSRGMGGPGEMQGGGMSEQEMGGQGGMHGGR